jgi:hypothetical protein
MFQALPGPQANRDLAVRSQGSTTLAGPAVLLLQRDVLGRSTNLNTLWESAPWLENPPAPSQLRPVFDGGNFRLQSLNTRGTS